MELFHYIGDILRKWAAVLMLWAVLFSCLAGVICSGAGCNSLKAWSGYGFDIPNPYPGGIALDAHGAREYGK